MELSLQRRLRLWKEPPGSGFCAVGAGSRCGPYPPGAYGPLVGVSPQMFLSGPFTSDAGIHLQRAPPFCPELSEPLFSPASGPIHLSCAENRSSVSMFPGRAQSRVEVGAANRYTPLTRGECCKLQTHLLLTPVWCGLCPTFQKRTGRPRVAAVTQPENMDG